MHIDLPLPILADEKRIVGCGIKIPTSGMIAEVKRITESGRYFKAVSFMLGKVIEYFIDEAEETIEANIQRYVDLMPYQSAEVVFLKCFAQLNGDRFEGFYTCPRCGKRLITEMLDDIDNRDSINDLEIIPADPDYDGFFEFELENPVIISLRGSTMEDQIEVEKIRMEYPKLFHGVQVEVKNHADSIAEQFAIFTACITEVNGDKSNEVWKRNFGSVFFKKLDILESKRLSKEIFKYGMKTTLKKQCRECGKEWDAHVNTANFFVSALQ